jgi:deazaflavin-dependent oxidoreductase (nitroreductase family)
MLSQTHPRIAADLIAYLSSSAGEDLRAASSRLRRAVARLAHQRWFAAFGRRLAPVDRVLYRATSGRLTIMGPQGVAMPQTLLLTTIGRRSGRPRPTPVMYLQDGERFVITSENFGQKRPAAWPLNLAVHPHATIQVGGQILSVRAVRATEKQGARYWPKFVEIWPAHESYKRRSGVRKMFVLEPVDDVRTTD